jgi:glycosyltransferase 2 family protein
MTEQPKPRRQRLVIGIVVALVIVGLLVVVLDWREVRKILGQTDWKLVPVALLFAFISYACLSFAFALVNRIFGVLMGWRDLAEVGFVSTLLNHLLSTGGAAGYSVRFLLMGAQGTSIKDILAASFFAFYINSLGMLALLPIGLVYLFARHPLAKGATVGVGVGAVLLIGLFILATALLFAGSLRTRLIRGLGRAARAVVHRDLGPTLDDFDATMTRGVTALRAHPGLLLLLLGLTVTDWGSSIAALWFCFDALGDPISLGVLLTGFAIGVTAGVLSMVPGGLGVQEGSMAGVYALLGVPLQKAVLASILFRVVYYLVPYLVSLGFYWRLLRQVGRATPEAGVSEE